jgi:hypothetical protein
MTVWFDLDGIDFAVTGEIVKGYISMFDRFEVKGVRVRSEAQNIKYILAEGFARKLAAAALETAKHPIPIPYDLRLQPPLAVELAKAEHRCTCGAALTTDKERAGGICWGCMMRTVDQAADEELEKAEGGTS